MSSPTEIWNFIKQKIKPQWKVAFWSALAMGLLIHMPMMMQDIPNHDGLDSMYFDQNMITSGRWFLTVACGISSYYTLPWLIGLLAILWIALTSVALTELLEVKKSWAIVLISGLLVSFPALASTFAYVFTMDGYMLALFLAVLSVLLTKLHKLGFLAGAVCLAFSMGTYQAYLPFAVLLSIYGILMIAMEQGAVKEKIRRSLRYLYMGILGAAAYYIILQILLRIQGKELASYQGINSMGTVEKTGLVDMVKNMYGDFFAFTLKGNVLMNNTYSVIALCILGVCTIVLLTVLSIRHKWVKSPWFYILLILLVLGLPVSTNIILFISPDVTYHVLMRYQWILYPIVFVAFTERYVREPAADNRTHMQEKDGAKKKHGNCAAWLEWAVICGAAVLVWNFAVTDHIAYSNLQKKYEKTYSYCVRLLDRIEQTPGYYQGIPIAMVGVVGDEPYPVTDITQDVTSNLIGMTGDYLLYTGENYRLFMEHYLGATLNILPAEAMAHMYYEEAYVQMNSFPAADSIQIIDGIMYVKTENMDKGLIAAP